MIEELITEGLFYKFDNLSSKAELNHFSTERSGGISIDCYASLNLGYNSGDSRDKVLNNRIILADLLSIELNALFIPDQSHGDSVLHVNEDFIKLPNEVQSAKLKGIDALITHLPRICICVLTADCAPIFIYDKNNKVIAMVHAGWRGTVKGIGVKTIQEMSRIYGSAPDELICGIGPSIGPDIYEVGHEVIEAVKYAFGDDSAQLLKNTDSDHALLNLWEANKILLTRAGVRPDNIEVAGICTYTHSHRFFSSRKNHGKTGRTANGMMLL